MREFTLYDGHQRTIVAHSDVRFDRALYGRHTLGGIPTVRLERILATGEQADPGVNSGAAMAAVRHELEERRRQHRLQAVLDRDPQSVLYRGRRP